MVIVIELAVLVAIDVVGYSKLSRETKPKQSPLCENIGRCWIVIESMGGRIFNTGSDSVFAEFGSAVQALKCAAYFQRDVHENNRSLEISDQMFFALESILAIS